MMGYGHGELVGRTIHDLLPEDYVPKTLTRTEEVWEEGLTLPQIPLRHKEGGTVFVEMNVSGLTVDGQRRLLGITRDITRRLEDERARVKTHLELQQKANELERFTFMNSHDLRNPLITIQSFLGVVENQLDSNAREQNADSFARIRDATGTMHQLLDEMMNFSRTGWRQLRVERVQPRLLIELVLAELAHDLEEAEVTVRGHYPPLTGDRSRLEVLFKNLVENAVKFRHPERPLRLEIEGSVRQNRLAITIRDNGVGIEPRFHNRVFELFEQLNVDTPGSGIGLALARRIVEQHGGRIGLEAEEDRKGLTLHMELPIAGPGEEEMHDQSEEVQP
jgi:signal transduction histidine kinase